MEKVMEKKIKKLTKRVCRFLGIAPINLIFSDIGIEDSRLDIKEETIIINSKFMDDYIECAKCITHEYRHIFQIYYAKFFRDSYALQWRKELSSSKEVVHGKVVDVVEYLCKDIELDAFAFTKFYLALKEDIEIKYQNRRFDAIVDEYISRNISVLNC